MKHQHNKGKISDNALKALVRSNLFRHKVERNKKGKGSLKSGLKTQMPPWARMRCCLRSSLESADR